MGGYAEQCSTAVWFGKLACVPVHNSGWGYFWSTLELKRTVSDEKKTEMLQRALDEYLASMRTLKDAYEEKVQKILADINAKKIEEVKKTAWRIRSVC